MPAAYDYTGLELLWKYVNIPVEQKTNRIIYIAYLISQLIPNTSRPILIISGRQGTRKTSLARITLKILDPSKIGTGLTANSKLEDLQITATQNYLYLIDNVTREFNVDQQDFLCQTVTGGVTNQRKLYTNHEMLTSPYIGTPIVTSTTNPITREDTLSRSLTLQLTKPTDVNRDDQETEDDFKTDLPHIHGALYRLLADTYQQLKSLQIHPQGLHRLPVIETVCFVAAQLAGYTVEDYTAMLTAQKQLREEILQGKLDTSEQLKLDLILDFCRYYAPLNETWFLQRFYSNYCTFAQTNNYDIKLVPNNMKTLPDDFNNKTTLCTLTKNGYQYIENKTRDKSGHNLNTYKITITQTDAEKPSQDSKLNTPTEHEAQQVACSYCGVLGWYTTLINGNRICPKCKTSTYPQETT